MSVVDSGELRGKVALVTGGSRGLGRAIAQGLATAGADVAVVSRKLDACVEAAAEITAATGRRAVGHSAHVGRWDQLDGLVDWVYEEFGRVDVLVNNAGMAPLYDDLCDISEELFDKVLAVNLKGPFRLAALLGRRMAGEGGGSIVNISSVAAIQPTASQLPYAAAKAGLDVVTAGLAKTYGPAVRVNSIMCGPFLTDISRAWDESTFDTLAQRLPLSRAGEPHEVVGAAVYLAGPSSSYVTGAILRIDGGQAISY
jgi:NAD(P)-dependent dehydrogenase (short-subunit alcohol dehydrogenase family)